MQEAKSVLEMLSDDEPLVLSPHHNRELTDDELVVVAGGIKRLGGITYADGYPSDHWQ
jgi:hypothetical protein